MYIWLYSSSDQKIHVYLITMSWLVMSFEFFSCIPYHSMKKSQKFRYTHFFLQMAYDQKISLTLRSNLLARRLGTSNY